MKHENFGDDLVLCYKYFLNNLFLFKLSILLKIRDLLLVLRRIEIEVLEKLLINEENTMNCGSDQLSLQNVEFQTKIRKRSNSVPESSSLVRVESNLNKRVKSVSNMSLIASNASQLIAKYDDNLSLKSVDSITTTTASVDSFEIALGMSSLI